MYLSALQLPHYNLATLLDDSPVQVTNEEGKVWQPENFDHQYRGAMPLYKAFSHSINIPAVNLGLDVGVDKVANTLRGLGAKGYINKGCPVDEMISAIVMVFRGRNYLSSAVATNLVFNTQEADKNAFSKLSSRELQIVSKIVDGHKIIDIADALAISPKTVNTHRYRVHEKLGINNDIELVRLAIDSGFV